jgi:phage virion morphogenesis protein
MITINIADGITPAIQRVLSGFSDASEAMSSIGEYLIESTRKNFVEQRAPDGTPWAPRAQSTLDKYRAKHTSFPARILHYDGILSSNIAYSYGPHFAEVSTARDYGAMMHFGGTKAQFPHLWGNIPARPYFGLSQEGENVLLDIVAEWIEGLVE